jgi:gluconolactonase
MSGLSNCLAFSTIAPVIVMIFGATTIAGDPAMSFAPPVSLRDDLTKADTPTWLAGEKCLLLTDLEQAKLWRFDEPEKFTLLREAACRGKAGPDGRFYGIIDGALSAWKLGDAPTVIAAKAAEGREFSLNDIAVGQRGFLYFTTLKDPDKGRLSIVEIATGKIRVLFDGAQFGELANPNGIALSRDGKWIYVGISNYQQRKHSGVYRFAIDDTGGIDVKAGRAQPWAAVRAPDGIAIDVDDNVFFTSGGQIHAYAAAGKRLGNLKLPAGSGTNLCFGGEDGRTIYVTTNKALYAFQHQGGKNAP